MPFRILSLNAWGGRVFEPLIAYLRDVEADVYCLQEVTRTRDAPDAWLEYRDGSHVLPQRASLFDEIGKALPDHAAAFFPAARGELFHGERAVPSEFGLATFVHARHAIIGEALGFVHGDYSPDGWGGHPRPRNAHCLRLFDRNGGRTLTVAHMHGLRDPAGKGNTAARVAQADALARLVPTVWKRGEPLVVCGDFNVLPGSTTFEALGRLGLADLVTGRGHTDTRTSLYPKDGRYADYMLATADVEVLAFDVVAEPEVSDHRALLLDMA